MYLVVQKNGKFDTAPTLAEAKRIAHASVARSARKDGNTLQQYKERHKRTVFHYVRVMNSKGRVVTGSCVYKIGV